MDTVYEPDEVDEDYCEVCGGTGEVENDDYSVGTCDWCDGTGRQ